MLKPIPVARGLRRGFAVARLLGLRVRTPPGHGYLSLMSVVCCQVEVSASGWSLVKRSSIECGVSECYRESSIMRRSWTTMGCRAIGGEAQTLEKFLFPISTNVVMNYNHKATQATRLAPLHFRRFPPGAIRRLQNRHCLNSKIATNVRTETTKLHAFLGKKNHVMSSLNGKQLSVFCLVHVEMFKEFFNTRWSFSSALMPYRPNSGSNINYTVVPRTYKHVHFRTKHVTLSLLGKCVYGKKPVT